METIKKTYQDLNEFYGVAQRYVQEHPEDNKLRYALGRTLKSAGRALSDYRDAVEEINVKHCLAADDGKGEILRDPNGQYKFTKDGMSKRNAEIAKLFRSTASLQVHFASELPKDLSLADRDNFVGFVIKEESVANSKVQTH